MNHIVIESNKAGKYLPTKFTGFWRKVTTRIRGGKPQEVHINRLLFVAGGRVGDTYDYGLRQAEIRAEKWRNKHPEIGEVVFKKT